MGFSTTTPGKKQQSISSFFTPKAGNGLSRKPSNQIQDNATIGRVPLTSVGNIYDADSDDEARSAAPTKRLLAEDGGTVNSASERIAKRVRSQSGDSTASEQIPTKPCDGNSKVNTRTEKYLYDASKKVTPVDLFVEDETETGRILKEALHRKFVMKLGHPDSLAHNRRKNWQNNIEATRLDDDDDDDEADGEEADGEPPPMKVKRKGARTGKLTPMELQMLDIKRKHLDTILIVEVGYKFKFFGEDARTAAKELGIVCIPGKFRFDEHPSEAHLDRFASASIPVHRLPVHVKRLVLAGHKVGVVRQIETAALKKAGDNRNTPFIRKLTSLYTKGTFIDDIEGLNQSVSSNSDGAPATGYLLCITETTSKGWGSDEKVDVGILAVQPNTGDVIYDNFEDGFMRSEIETRLLHISPCEFLIVGDITRATEKLIEHLSSRSTNVFGEKIRIERVERPKIMAAQSYSHVAQFYADRMKSEASSDDRASGLLDEVLKLPELVTITLSAMITHMTEYGLENVFDLTKYFQSFSARSHMLLNGNTLTNLEIYHNQTDYTEKGSLFWALDKTQTRFGQRLLRKWLGRPLLDKAQLEKRIAAVEELKEGAQTTTVDKLKSLLMKVKSDLERSLIRIYYGKCSRPELLTVLQTMQRISNEFASIRQPSDAGFKSTLLNELIAALPMIGEAVVSILDKINLEAARSDDKYAFFLEAEESDDVTNHKIGIAAVEQDLDAHRPIAAEKIRKKSVNYSTVAGIEYLIEISNTELRNVPASWAKISGTKKVSRFHTPEVIRLIRERDQHKESLAAACDAAFSTLLKEVATHYQSFRDTITCLSTLDCLLSLATVASQPGYVKPEYSSNTDISIIDGRHPMVEQLLLDAYVPNSTTLSSENGTRALLITGPNMGGKSSYVRSTALICIMAQIGSYVPAAVARIGMLDAIFTRMGAFDNMMAGESTFMVELSETADILKQATPRSLVILDELGRGTSTHDGVAIAQAVLEHVVQDIKCLTLFITHYQTLASVANGFTNGELKNVHMAFEAQVNAKGEEDITFIYQVSDGVAHRSYGLNVARLARVPRPVLDTAAVKSAELEEAVRQKKLKGLAGIVEGVMEGGNTDQLNLLVAGIEQL